MWRSIEGRKVSLPLRPKLIEGLEPTSLSTQWENGRARVKVTYLEKNYML